MSEICGLAESLAYPSMEEGSNFLIQMISTCLPSRRGRGAGGQHPVVKLRCSYSDDIRSQLELTLICSQAAFGCTYRQYGTSFAASIIIQDSTFLVISNGKTSIVYYRTLSFFAFRF